MTLLGLALLFDHNNSKLMTCKVLHRAVHPHYINLQNVSSLTGGAQTHGKLVFNRAGPVLAGS